MTVRFLDQADEIIVLDSSRVQHQGNYETLRASDSLPAASELENEDEKGTQETSSEKTIMAQEASTSKELDNLQSGGDTTLYWYYLRTFGWKLGLSLTVAGIAVAAMNPVSRRFLVPYSCVIR